MVIVSSLPWLPWLFDTILRSVNRYHSELIMTSGRAALSPFVVLQHCLTIHSAYQKDLSRKYTRTLYQAMTPNATSHTYTVSLEASNDNVLLAIHKFDSLTNKAKLYKRCRLSRNNDNSYYNISRFTSILLLLMKSFDVSPNPGPTEQKRIHTPKHMCSRCGKGVTGRSRAISCDSCDQWTHNKCAGIFLNDEYD